MSPDAYRLKAAPDPSGGRYLLRIRENEQEVTTLDEARLVVVDHAPGQRVSTSGGRVVIGERAPAHRVTTSSGTDITHLINGSSEEYFAGEPGDTLLVVMNQVIAAASPGFSMRSQPEHVMDDPGGSGSLEGDPKEEPQARIAPEGDYFASAATSDAAVLASTGIEIQAQDGSGGWRTLAQYYPRLYRDETAVDSMAVGEYRLIFRGRHRLRFVGRMVTTTAASGVDLSLVAARHSRSGDVLTALGAEGGATTALAPGDTVTLEFTAIRETPGMVRDWFLVTKGVYTGVTPARSHPIRPTGPMQFALHQNQPNPFSAATSIAFDVARRERVKIELFDLAGRRVAVVVDQDFPPGRHAIDWQPQDRAGRRRSGVFICRMTAGEFRSQRKIAVVP